jgi:hypothetical protein
MMPVLSQSTLDDAICVWLDEVVSLLEQNECLFWPHGRDISLPEALRAALFCAAKKAVRSASPLSSRRKAMRFPTSVISRVQNAISHLGQFAKAQVEPKNVVFLPMSVAELAHQVPVAQALQETGKTAVFVFQSPKWAEEMPLEGVEVLEHSKALQSRLLCARLRARVMWLRLGREETLSLPKLHFEGKEFDLNSIVIHVFLSCVTAAFEGHALARFLAELVQPKLLVLSDELQPYRRVIVSVARRQGIRCVDLISQLQDSPIDAYRLCDRFVVFGNYAKRILLASGIDTKKIKSCGTPYLDALALRKHLPFLTGENESKKTKFVVADIDEKWAPALRRIAQQLPSLFVLFLAKRRRPALSLSPNFRLVLRSEVPSSQYAACLKSAEVILVEDARSGIEALSLGKAVVAIDFDGAFNDREFLKARVVPVAADESELLRVLSNPGHELDESGRRFWEDYFSRKDGQSAQRVASVIIEECQK